MRRPQFCETNRLWALAVVLSGLFGVSPVAADEKNEPAASGGKIHTIVLRTVTDRGADHRKLRHLLAREIFRQALLTTAREDFGLTTRDEALGESAADSEEVATFQCDALFENNLPSGLKISRLQGTKTEVVLERKFERGPKEGLNYEKLLTEAAELAKEKFPAIFEHAGCAKRDLSAAAEAELPPDVALHLGQMRIISQFSAVRAAHQIHSQSKPSFATSAALVRGYANLGLLTDFLFHPAHKVFKARALVYAQRFAQQAPDDPRGRWLQGYALALTGFHGRALVAIQRGDELREKMAAKNRPPISSGAPTEKAESTTAATPKPANEMVVKRPQWVATVARFCRFETDKLDADLADDDLKELTQVLKFVTIDACQVPNQTVEAAIELLTKLPECYLVHDALCQAGGVSVLHSATVNGPQVFATTLPPRLAELRGLPDNVLLAAEGNARFAELVPALEAAGRQPAAGEGLSWGALGRVLREVMFVHVWRRLNFMFYGLGVDSDEFIDAMAPALSAHPYWLFLEARRWEVEPRKQAVVKLVEQLDTTNLEVNCISLYSYLYGGEEFSAKLYPRAYYQSDLVERDMRIRLREYMNKANTARGMLGVSPHAPYPVAILIENDWKYSKPHADEWEKQHQQHAGVLSALGAKYLQLRRLDDAERCLKSSIKLVPARWQYQLLADVYAKRGDRAQWQATLDEFLTKPDYALDHAQIRVAVAQYFMDEGQWEKALPYAKDAAETWAAWAMIAACRCYEELGKYEESEQWMTRLVDRYRGHEYQWYAWCRRTGRGDLAGARKAVEKRIEKIADREGLEDVMELGMYYTAEHQPQKAYECYARCQRKINDPSCGLHAAILADQLQKPADRDAALELIHTDGAKYLFDGKPPAASLIDLAQLWADSLHSPDKAPLDLEKLQKLHEQAGVDQTNLDYFACRILQSAGRTTEAKRYLELCAKSPREKLTRTLARAFLQEPDFLADRAAEKDKPAAEKEKPVALPASKPISQDDQENESQ